MAEHALHGPLIGVAFDGTGYGPDGTVWGGEFLVCDQASYRRAGHLTPVRQPGGDLCAREGWRMAASYLLAAGLAPGTPPDHDERAWRLVCRLATSDMAPLSSSAGRLFDAVASLLGVAHTSSFEAEAAMQLETLARGIDADSIDALPVEVLEGGMLQLATPALVRQMVEQRDAGRSAEELAAVFHESIAQAIVDICCRLAAAERLTRVALSGGVFQNRRLLERSTALLGARGLDVYTNHLVPANDGGISLGQALVAASSVQP
jgi:hydrogenase maturation protein HypF